MENSQGQSLGWKTAKASEGCCLWPALSRCFAGFASYPEELHQCHGGGGDPAASALVSQPEVRVQW